jgi:hypothetical protein
MLSFTAGKKVIREPTKIRAQGDLFDHELPAAVTLPEPRTFLGNMIRPVHRWFRYSAGFSAEWAETVIRDAAAIGTVRVFDPFAGSATTLLAAESAGVESYGIEAHPFVYRIARAKLEWRSDAQKYRTTVSDLLHFSSSQTPNLEDYPALIHACYTIPTLEKLDRLRRAYEALRDDTPASELAWLTIIAILRKVSRAGTAQWQYVLPNKTKRAPADVSRAFREAAAMMYADMRLGEGLSAPRANLLQSDARNCAGVPTGFANLVVTSPPYPNNFDYADATRLEMSFMGEVRRWADLHQTVRRHLVASCSQHVNEKTVDLEEILSAPELTPIRSQLAEVCHQLAEVRKSRGGRKAYHLMIACYFRDMALAWRALRVACASPSKVCFVIGDSAPYGVYVPVVPWLETLAVAGGFKSHAFEKTRDRNVKWKNRKHRIPLLEGKLWVKG